MVMTFRTFRTRRFVQTVQAKRFERSLSQKGVDLSNLSNPLLFSKRIAL